MKVLFDQNVPRALRKITPQHITNAADEMGWGELVNGDLLRAAEDGGFTLFVTADRNIRSQQNLAGRKIAIIELSTNDWSIIKNEPQRYALTVSSAKEGSYQTINYALPPRRHKPPRRPSV